MDNQLQNEVIQFIYSEEIKNLSEMFQKNIEEQEENKNNIFSIISNNYHYEKYHSNVLFFLLSEESIFKSFLKLLGLQDKIYDNYKVYLEYSVVNKIEDNQEKKGYIDLLILDDNLDDNSKRAIIIENKINNAEDQENQLDRYYEAINEKKYEIDAIIYLSLDGKKELPKVKFNKDLIRQIAASSKDNEISIHRFLKDFANDLLENKEFKDDKRIKDLYSFINQYIKLLNHLKGRTMDNSTKQEFYDIIKNDPEKLETAYAFYNIYTEFNGFFLEKINNDYLNEFKFEYSEKYSTDNKYPVFLYEIDDLSLIIYTLNNDFSTIKLGFLDNKNWEEFKTESRFIAFLKEQNIKYEERKDYIDPCCIHIIKFKFKELEKMKEIIKKTLKYFKK